MKTIASCILVYLCLTPAFADEYIKDGKLTHTLRIQQLQGGFAGFTGKTYTVNPDGSWTSVSVFNKKTRPDASGRLSPRELTALADVLARNELSKLPARVGKAPGANPYSLTFEFGKTKVEYIGQVPPRLDEANPTSPESRIASIWQGWVNVANTSKAKETK